ncbi:MAG: ATP-binding protein, partial [Planctomycetota bacterium]
LYRPSLLATARLHYAKSTANVDLWREVTLVRALEADDVGIDPWTDAEAHAGAAPETEDEPESGARYATLPAEATQPKRYTQWKRSLVSHLYREHPLPLWRHKRLKVTSEPGESEGDFRARLAQLDRERRDLDLEKLRTKYAPKVERLQERIRKAEQRVEVETDQYESQKRGTLISLGATVLGAIFGRKKVTTGTVGRAGTTMRGAGRAASQKQDIARARENVKALQDDLKRLEAEFEAKVDQLEAQVDPTSFEIEAVPIRPRKSDIGVDRLVLAWAPWKVDRDGIAERV